MTQQRLKTHLAVPLDQQNHIWQARLFDLLPEARYSIPVQFNDSMARPFLGCMIEKDDDIASKSFAEVVHAAMKQEKKGEKNNVLWSEFGSSDVYRRFELPNSIYADKVTAHLENGLLQVSAPEVAKLKGVAAKA